MASKKKVMIICDEQSNISHLAELSLGAFPADHYAITFIYLFHEPKVDQSHCNVQYIYLRARNKFMRRPYMIRQIARLCQRIQPDLMITHGWKPFALTAVATAGKKMPKLGVFHGLQIFKRRARKLLARLFARDWQIMGVSQATTHSLKQCLPYAADRYHTIPNAVDVNKLEHELLSRAQARQQLGLAADAFVFGVVARVVPSKGHRYLIEAFNQLALPNAQLAIIGEGRSRATLEHDAANLPVQQQIIFMGRKENAAQYMRAFDVFVLPSLSEAFGMVLLEAMAARIPIIATQIGGIEEVVDDLATLVPCKNAEALKQAMHDIVVLSAEERARQGEALHQRLQQQFTSQVYCQRYRELCEHLLQVPL